MHTCLQRARPESWWQELFVYVRMGGKSTDIIVELLGDVDMRSTLTRFDAAKARCYHERDRQKLLAVVESAFGTCDPFNKAVRAIFHEKLQLGDGISAVERPPDDVGANINGKQRSASKKYEIHPEPTRSAFYPPRPDE